MTHQETTHVAALLDELQRVPAASLPGGCRQALAEAIRTSEVDGLYRPIGSDQYNVTFSAWPPALDPRMKLSAWVEAWQAGRSPSDVHATAQIALQLRAVQQEAAAVRAEIAACAVAVEQLRRDLQRSDQADQPDTDASRRL